MKVNVHVSCKKFSTGSINGLCHKLSTRVKQITNQSSHNTYNCRKKSASLSEVWIPSVGHQGRNLMIPIGNLVQ